jgi:hypothetical protein
MHCLIPNQGEAETSSANIAKSRQFGEVAYELFQES